MWNLPGGRERLGARPPEHVQAMRVAGLLVGRTLEALTRQIQPGCTTADLDTFAAEFIRAGGGVPSFPEVPGYRHTLCVSVNEEVVHGIPGPRVLRSGDVVSIDCGASIDGWHGDSAITVIVGGEAAAHPEDVELVAACTEGLWAGIAAFTVGSRLFDIGAAVEDAVDAAAARVGREGYGILEGFEGHGIGRAMHESPGVPNVAVRPRGPKVAAGATVAIEPMITLGSEHGHTMADEWTVVTTDGSRSAHVEHTVAATPNGPWVLTALDGGRAELARRGVTCGAPANTA